MPKSDRHKRLLNKLKRTQRANQSDNAPTTTPSIPRDYDGGINSHLEDDEDYDDLPELMPLSKPKTQSSSSITPTPASFSTSSSSKDKRVATPNVLNKDDLKEGLKRGEVQFEQAKLANLHALQAFEERFQSTDPAVIEKTKRDLFAIQELSVSKDIAVGFANSTPGSEGFALRFNAMMLQASRAFDKAVLKEEAAIQQAKDRAAAAPANMDTTTTKESRGEEKDPQA